MTKEEIQKTRQPKLLHKCQSCKNYISDRQCIAFWGEIPDDIWENKVEHDKVRDEQMIDAIYEGKPIM